MGRYGYASNDDAEAAMALAEVPVNRPENGEPPDADALLAFCGEKLPRYMVPKSVEFLDALPKTSSGKVDYPALRRREGL